jgi:hypothetical protein
MKIDPIRTPGTPRRRWNWKNCQLDSANKRCCLPRRQNDRARTLSNLKQQKH